MERYSKLFVLFLALIPFLVNPSVIFPQQETQTTTTDQQQSLSKDEVPITTTSPQARDKYLEGLKYADNIQFEKAKTLFQDAINADPNFALGYVGLAATSGSYSTSKQYFDKAESLMDKVSEGEKHLISFSKAQFEGNTSKEKDEIQKLLSMFPKDKRVAFIAGTFEQFSNRNFDAAIQHYQKAVQIDPNYAPAYNVMGYAYSDKNDFNKAEEAFKKYISLLPDSPNPYDSYAELLLKNGRYDASIEQYQKALDIDPVFVSALEGIGNNYLFKGDYAKAREYYQTAFDKSPSFNWKYASLYNEAVSYVREGNITNALSTLDKRISLAENDNSIPTVVGTHNMEGFILAENGKPDEAMKHFDMASEKIESSNLPDNLKDNLMSDVKLNKLYGMVTANKLDAASNELQNKDQVLGSANTPQNNKKYEAIRGLLSLKQNKFDEALSHFNKADNEDPMTWYYQAMAYQKKGETQKATQLIDKIKQSNQNSVELAVANNHAKEIVAQTK